LDEDIVCGPDIPLTIDEDKELGSGGSALVLRGEINNNDTVSKNKSSSSFVMLFLFTLAPTSCCKDYKRRIQVYKATYRFLK